MTKLKNILSRFFCCLSFSSTTRKRRRNDLAAKKKGNKIIWITTNGNRLAMKPSQLPSSIKLKVLGNDNTLIFHAPFSPHHLSIIIFSEAHHNHLEFGAIPPGTSYNADIHVTAPFGDMKIGAQTGIGGLTLVLCGGKCHIGENCMLSDQITIWTHDSHCLIDMDTGDLINGNARGVEIGNDCWIGQGAALTKNAVLPPHTVVGLKSVVTRMFSEEYTVLTGQPARVARRNVTWSRQREWEYRKNGSAPLG